MSQDFIRPNNPTIEQLVAEATSGDNIGENFQNLRDALASAPAQASEVPMSPQPTFKFERDLRFAESTGRQALVIRATSEAELTRLENNILYGHD